MDTNRHLTADIIDATNDAAFAAPARPDSRIGGPVSPPDYEATVVSYDDEPDECTIYPADATEDELVTTWISAKSGSYVSLADAR
ncbi:hypothetical protein SAMN04488063_2530 [Halopelagius inordinatus]|uniref:DUF7511 domain-containing protein n=1 Tax=Halopelagius inordinatus TaxID=553467 RepID=A0A1I2T3F0_9EURY|nr:hypothetical protein [Halopelagius inordinatus]SFG59584.1 hypothetical protein SAMN04488063_2530 [Halopelagius inordinatus]